MSGASYRLPPSSGGTDMARTRWHAVPLTAALLAASTVALITVPLHSQGHDTDHGRPPGVFACAGAQGHARAHQGARQVARRQPDGRVRRARGLDLSAAQLRHGPIATLSGGVPAARLHGHRPGLLRADGPATASSSPSACSRAGAAREMILVMPNCMNAYGGSMYSNSVTAGTGKATSPRISSPTWTATTARSPRARAADSPVTRWAATARCGSG